MLVCRRSFVSLSLLLLVSIIGCGDAGLEVSQRQLNVLGELRDNLATITDATTLKSALPNLEKISHRLVVTNQDMEKQMLTTEHYRDLRNAHLKEITKLTNEISAQAQRIDSLNLDEKSLEQFLAAVAPAAEVAAAKL